MVQTIRQSMPSANILLSLREPQSNTFRFAIAPPLIKPKFPIFPDLTVEKAVTLANGALAAPAGIAEAPGFVRACIQRPCPTSIDFLEPGMFVVNYRNEPVGLRVYNPNKPGPDAVAGKDCGPAAVDRTGCGAQADGLNDNNVNVLAEAGDLAFALQSRTDRAIPELNVMPGKGAIAGSIPGGHGAQVNRDATVGPFPVAATNLAPTVFPPHINVAGFEQGDPYTPMVRTYSGDRVRIKAQAGGDEEEHSISVHGVKWLQGGSGFGRAPNSGWKNQTAGGISEQFNLASPVFMDFSQRAGVADYLYMMDAHQDGFWNGDWGIMRNYNAPTTNLVALPNNPRPVVPANRFAFQAGDRAICPQGAPLKTFNITAVSANLALAAPPPGVKDGVSFPTVITPSGDQVLAAATALEPGQVLPTNVDIATLHAGGPLTGTGSLVSNPRPSTVKGTAQGITVDESGPLHDPTAMMYVLTGDLDATGKLKAGVPVEPFAMRVNAGDCVQVTLRNALPAVAADLPNYNQFRQAVKRDRNDAEGSTVFGVNLVRPSSHAGFHTQLLEYDVTRSDGTNVGINPVQTVEPGGAPKTYTFYAGNLQLAELPLPGGLTNLDTVLPTAVEFGGVNVLPADRVKQPQKALYGQMVVMPRGASFANPTGTTRLQGDVTAPALARRAGNALGTEERPATQAQNYRDLSLVWAKMHNHRYASGNPVQNESEEGPGLPENPPHTMHAYGELRHRAHLLPVRHLAAVGCRWCCLRGPDHGALYRFGFDADLLRRCAESGRPVQQRDRGWCRSCHAGVPGHAGSALPHQPDGTQLQQPGDDLPIARSRVAEGSVPGCPARRGGFPDQRQHRQRRFRHHRRQPDADGLRRAGEQPRLRPLRHQALQRGRWRR